MKEQQANNRITRLRRRFVNEVPFISIQRARYYTEKWRETQHSSISLAERVALCMKHVYDNMDFCIDPDDRIAGGWTEYFMGIPIDIERGLFNDVFEIELDAYSMILHQLKSNLRFVLYMIKHHGVFELYRNLKKTKAIGTAMPSIGTQTMNKRRINPYQILPEDKKILQKELLPFWKGKTIVDLIKTEMDKADLHRGDMADFNAALPSSTSRNDMVISVGSAIGLWQGHLILDHESFLKKGLSGMRQDVQNILEQNGNIPDDERAFVKSVDIALEGVSILTRRLAEKLKKELYKAQNQQRSKILSEMLEICHHVPFNPPRTFREAVQSYWTIKTAVELAIPFNVHAPGRLDQIFYPYYKKDLVEGRITPEQAGELFEELFLKIMSHNMRPYSNFTAYFTQRYEGSEPVTMGGLTSESKDATNELTYIMLDAAARSKAALNFAVRLHKNSPDDLRLKVAELHSQCNSSISLMNDEVAIPALEKRGFSHDDALGYAVTGCVDMCAPGKTGGEAFCALLLCRVLDMTLRNGDAEALVCTVKNTGLKTGEPDSFSSFDEFFEAFCSQASLQIKNIVNASRARDSVYAGHLPAPYISAFMQGCLDKKKDITHGGALYDLEGILFMNSIANLIDSLFVIKKLIFEQQRFTLRELVDAIDNNFVGFEDIHRMILNLEGKWGNGNPETDELARNVTTRLFEETYKYRTYKGGVFAPFINSMTAHTYDGRLFIATPDGRKAAKPFAASCNPYNVDTRGPTGVLTSVTALDFSHVLGCAVNIRMHPSGIGQSDDTRKKWISLVDTYFKMGGEQLQPTVVSTEVLREAQREPEKYQDVIVKVGGYSAYFTDLGHEIQEEIISRSEHRMV